MRPRRVLTWLLVVLLVRIGIASDMYHPLRFLATLPVTTVGLSLVSANQLAIEDAFAMGATVSTRLDKVSFGFANRGRFMAHEVKHTDQWGLMGAVRQVSLWLLTEDGSDRERD